MARSLNLLLVATLAACALPPRETDRSTPENCFRTFRGAVARAEHEREFDCLSDHFRAQLGIESRLDWKDARAVVLTQRHMAIKGLSRAKITGPAEPLPDGRVRLPVAVDALFVRVSGTLTLRRVVVLRAWRQGEEEPTIDWRLPDLRLTMASDGLGVTLPKEDRDLLFPELERGMELSRFEAAWIWFLDGFSLGNDNTDTIQSEVDQQRGD
ncbi:MAG: hypothetical protein ACYS0E_20180 [Planctomycetota bacterium]